MSGHYQRCTVFAKTETTEGTYNDPTTGGTALLLEDFSWAWLGEPEIARGQLMAARAGVQAPRTGPFAFDLGFTTSLYHWGDTSSATDYPLAPFLAGCPVTITPGGSDDNDLTIRPKATQPDSFSMAFQWKDGNLYKVRGCKAIIEEISADDIGAIIKVKWKVHGLWEDTPAAGSVDFSAVTYDTHEEVANGATGEAATVNVGISGVGCLVNWTFSPGMTITPRRCQTATYGFSPSRVDHGDYATLQFNSEETVEGTYAVWAAALARTEATSTALTFPGAGNDTAAIDLPKTTVGLPLVENVNDLAFYNQKLTGQDSSGRCWGITMS